MKMKMKDSKDSKTSVKFAQHRNRGEEETRFLIVRLMLMHLDSIRGNICWKLLDWLEMFLPEHLAEGQPAKIKTFHFCFLLFLSRE